MRVQIRSQDGARPEQTIIWEGTLRDILHTDKTKILLVNTPTFGNIVFMDGAVQSSEYDYELYHRVLVRPLARYIGIHGNEAIVLGGGEGCTSAELRQAGARHITQVDHDRQAIEWAEKMLADWNHDIYKDTDSLNVIYEDAFAFAEREEVRAPYIVVDLFDPDTTTLGLYSKLLVELTRRRLNKKGNNGAVKCGIVSYFGLWPHVGLTIDTIAAELTRAGLSDEFTVHGYVHYIPSFCSECLFLVIVPTACQGTRPILEAGSRWVF